MAYNMAQSSRQFETLKRDSGWPVGNLKGWKSMGRADVGKRQRVNDMSHSRDVEHVERRCDLGTVMINL